MKKLTSIDLFTGAGGLTEGFRLAGFETLFANDFDKWCVETFKVNHPDVPVTCESIVDIDCKKLRNKLNLRKGELDVLLGGPPCQGFSTYGKRDSNDPRNRLFEHYVHFLTVFRPKAFVMENVLGILSMNGGAIKEEIERTTSKLGYQVNIFVLDAANYGVPQLRKRVFFVGTRSASKILPPTQTHFIELNGVSGNSNKNQQNPFEPNLVRKQALTVRDAIFDLPNYALKPKQAQVDIEYESDKTMSDYQKEMRSDCSSLSHHSAKQMLGIRRLRLGLMKPGDYGREIRTTIKKHGLPEKVINELLGENGTRDLKGVRKQDAEKEIELRNILSKGHIDIDAVLEAIDSGGFANKYRRLKWECPSHTLVAHMARDCSDFVHPEYDRFITVREAARLQSFSDSYHFFGSQFQQFKQIGNAVPPLLAKAVANQVKEHILFLSDNELKNESIAASV